MIKKIIFSLLLFCIVPIVNASTTPMAKVGDKFYDTLEEAIANASSTDTIMLVSDAVLDDTLLINKTVNLNLNGNDISAKEKVFLVQGGTLNVSGKGTIKETQPNYGAIMVIGSANLSDNNYSVVNIGKDVTLEGWSGIFITHENSKSYGVEVNLDGKINAINDTSGGTGIGVYVNGKIMDETNSPEVNILDNAEITSTGNGLYIAGTSTFNIGKAYISGVESGIGIKSGTLNIDGATVVSDGKDETPTEGYNNGIKASGTAIQIESNSSYAGKIQLNISNGEFKSKNSYVVYEYLGKGNDSLIYSMSISNGTFISESGKDVFSFSDSFKDIHSGFISGGQYSSDPSEYLKSGYSAINEGGIYSVAKNTLKGVNSSSVSGNSGSSFIKSLIWIIVIAISGILVYFNRGKIVNFFRDIKYKFK
ncbi:MAG: hypothetical protein IJY25_02775 [Bacilli bacterium]|nr:hypothetical protein [Bacilli bacterium]